MPERAGRLLAWAHEEEALFAEKDKALALYKRVLALDYKDPILHVIDPATDKIVEDITLQGNNSAGARVRFSPDGSKIVTDNSGQKLVNILSASDLLGGLSRDRAWQKSVRPD